MSRFIDADELIEMCKRQIECEWNTIAAPGNWSEAFQDFSDLVEQTPTADVAREIFEEIDRVVEKYSMGDIEYPAFIDIIANLKKKYTEGNV